MLLQDQRFRELDGMRGIACLSVLLDHCIFSNIPAGAFPGLYRLSGWLISGVDLFFVLSGFLIGGILLDHKNTTNYFRVFWVRRIGRIMPVYYLLIASFFAVLLIRPWLPAPWLDQFLLKDMMPVWTYPLFIQNFAQSLDGGDGGARWVASTWSLGIEEQFYLLLPPLIYILSRRKAVALAVAGIVAALFVRGYLWRTSGSWFTAYFLLPGRMDSLMFGLLGALALRHIPAMDLLRRHRRRLDVLAVLTAIILSTNVLTLIGSTLPIWLSFIVRSSDFTFRAAIFFYAIMRIFLVPEGSAYRRALSSPVLVGTGIISYSLYMYHPVVNGLLYGIFYGGIPRLVDLPTFLTALAVIAISVGLAWTSTRYYERPIRRWAHRVKYHTAPNADRLRPQVTIRPGLSGAGSD